MAFVIVNSGDYGHKKPRFVGGALELFLNIVIASEGTERGNPESIPVALDCFVVTLLAMTRITIQLNRLWILLLRFHLLLRQPWLLQLPERLWLQLF